MSILSRVVRTAIALVATVALVPALHAQPAAALSWTNTGQAGAVTVTTPMTAAYDQLLPSAGYPRLFQTNGMVVRRSPASTGTQLVGARYYLQRWSGTSWVTLEYSAMYSGYVSGNGTLSFPKWAVAPVQLTATAPYRFVYVIAWQDTSGRTLGGQTLYPSNASENACYTRVRNCRVYSDSVVL